jgi:hypothetical protein
MNLEMVVKKARPHPQGEGEVVPVSGRNTSGLVHGVNSLVTWSVTGSLATSPGAFLLIGESSLAVTVYAPGIYAGSCLVRRGWSGYAAFRSPQTVVLRMIFNSVQHGCWMRWTGWTGWTKWTEMVVEGRFYGVSAGFDHPSSWPSPR